MGNEISNRTVKWKPVPDVNPRSVEGIATLAKKREERKIKLIKKSITKWMIPLY